MALYKFKMNVMQEEGWLKSKREDTAQRQTALRALLEKRHACQSRKTPVSDREMAHAAGRLEMLSEQITTEIGAISKAGKELDVLEASLLETTKRIHAVEQVKKILPSEEVHFSHNLALDVIDFAEQILAMESMLLDNFYHRFEMERSRLFIISGDPTYVIPRTPVERGGWARLPPRHYTTHYDLKSDCEMKIDFLLMSCVLKPQVHAYIYIYIYIYI